MRRGECEKKKHEKSSFGDRPISPTYRSYEVLQIHPILIPTNLCPQKVSAEGVNYGGERPDRPGRVLSILAEISNHVRSYLGEQTVSGCSLYSCMAVPQGTHAKTKSRIKNSRNRVPTCRKLPSSPFHCADIPASTPSNLLFHRPGTLITALVFYATYGITLDEDVRTVGACISVLYISIKS